MMPSSRRPLVQQRFDHGPHVQRMRCLKDDQQCFRCNRVVPDLLQFSDDFTLAGDMLLADGNARLGLCQMPYQRFTVHSLAYHRSALTRFNQPPAGIGKADRIASLNSHPSSRDGIHDGVHDRRLHLLQHPPLLWQARAKVSVSLGMVSRSCTASSTKISRAA